MSDPKTVLEGTVKYRDRKKWKARWAVVSKLSPVADCLHLQLYRDSKERCKNGQTKASLSLEGFLGMETGFTLDKESNTIALICSELVVVLAFDSRELLIQWQVKIRANLADEQQFLVQISHLPPKSKLSCGPARLHLQDYTFCVVAGVPPRLLGIWPIKELRRFGVIEGKFCFEGGSLCGKGEGLHVLLTNQCEELAHAMDLASKGKLLGKQKALSRKNSVLETSSRTPIHKALRNASEKCNTADSGRPLLSSGSEGSTCDACSEILRSGCDESTYNSASTKASSCRIHYRWPSCMSRWGQSSTTASDVESMDTVSVTLSDYQGPGHSTVSSKASSHGASFLCLCDTQGTWPFNHCNKCGRQFYSRSSLGLPETCHHHVISPEMKQDGQGSNGFSPQWTMDAALISPSNETNRANFKKESAYQLMVPPSDRVSLCSHASRSSSGSTASSSGSEYSVPRNFLDSLYDKPRTLHVVRNGTAIQKSRTSNGSNVPQLQLIPTGRRTGVQMIGTNKEIVCPCHEPISNWKTSDAQLNLPCSCWNQLALSIKTEKNLASGVSLSEKSSSAEAPRPPSPKKVQTNSAGSTRTNTLPPFPYTFPPPTYSFLPATNSEELPCTCQKGSTDPDMHYAIPKSTIANMIAKEKQTLVIRQNEGVTVRENPISNVSAEYDVPKKFVDILTSSDMALKSSLKVLESSTACSCKNVKLPISHARIQKTSETKIFHRYESSQPDNIQMCTCQRLVLWAGSFVPCIGGPTVKSTDHSWQCNKGIGYPNGNSRAIPNHYGTICCEPPRTAEVVLVNGKPKRILSGQKNKESKTFAELSPFHSDKNKLKSKESLTDTTDDKNSSGDKSRRYPHTHNNFQAQACSSNEESEIFSPVNYANLDFPRNVFLYENSNIVLNRLETNNRGPMSPVKPSLPPRGQTNTGNSKKNDSSNNYSDNTNSCKHLQACLIETQRKLQDANGSVYELMDFENQETDSCQNDDYLMMQPVYYDTTKGETEMKCVVISDDVKEIDTQTVILEDSPELPLRPFMPFSYPHFDNAEAQSNEYSLKGTQTQSDTKYVSDMVTRKCHLIDEDLELRSSRSNSFSELKKIVLLRKRSSSVDGKNSPVDQGVKSNPASPICSPKPSAQRKTSLFSKLNLRCKEKSMSTNEINPPAALPTSPNLLSSYKRCNLHRSADCLKVNEEYVISDDDLSNDASEVSVKENVVMKRSSSVPCRSAMPANLPSPRKINVTVIPEVNDMNKTSNDTSPSLTETDSDKELVHRSYSLSSKDKPNKGFDQGYKSDCDNACIQGDLTDHCGEMLQIQGIQKRVNSNGVAVNISCSDRYKNTASSSSSDTSDFIESLSHCSRSSSTSSGSSCDYIRSEDLYLKKYAKSFHTEIPSNLCGQGSSLPKVNQSPRKAENSSNLCVRQNLNHGNRHQNYTFLTSSATSSSPTINIVQETDRSLSTSDIIYSEKESDPINIQKDSASAMINATRSSNSQLRSPTSPSSLSTSPSITDCSSSSSGNVYVSFPTVKIREDIGQSDHDSEDTCRNGRHPSKKTILFKKGSHEEPIGGTVRISYVGDGALISKKEKRNNM